MAENRTFYDRDAPLEARWVALAWGFAPRFAEQIRQGLFPNLSPFWALVILAESAILLDYSLQQGDTMDDAKEWVKTCPEVILGATALLATAPGYPTTSGLPFTQAQMNDGFVEWWSNPAKRNGEAFQTTESEAAVG